MQAHATKKEFTDWFLGCVQVSERVCFIYNWHSFWFPSNHCPASPSPPTLPDQASVWSNDTHSPHRAPCLWVHLFTILAGITGTISTPPLWPCITVHHHQWPYWSSLPSALSPHPGHSVVTVFPIPGLSVRPLEFPRVWMLSTFQIIFSSPFPVWPRPGPDWWLSTPSLCPGWGWAGLRMRGSLLSNTLALDQIRCPAQSSVAPAPDTLSINDTDSRPGMLPANISHVNCKVFYVCWWINV